MSGSVLVVQEEPTGMWTAFCIDGRCLPEWRYGEGSHEMAYTRSKRAAEAAATVHRKLLATMPDEGRWPPKPSQCGTCLQSKTAITQLQELVRRLEQQLAEATAGEQR